MKTMICYAIGFVVGWVSKFLVDRTNRRKASTLFLKQRKANCEGCRYLYDDGIDYACRRSVSETRYCLAPSYSLREELVHKEKT